MIFHHELFSVCLGVPYCMAPWGSPNRFGDVSFSALCLGVRPSEKEQQDPTSFISKCAKSAVGLWNSDSEFSTSSSGLTFHKIWHVNTFSKLSQELWHQRSWTLVHVEEELLCPTNLLHVVWFQKLCCHYSDLDAYFQPFASGWVQWYPVSPRAFIIMWWRRELLRIQDSWGYMFNVSLT